MSLGEKLVAYARSLAGRFYYTNDWWSRMNPWESGGTDCSGFARLCYLEFGRDIGTWTGDESQSGTEVARGHYAWEIPWDDMKPGDLIFMTATYWNNYNFDEYLCHVEIYCGGGTMIGHPSGWGPTEKWAQAWMEAYGCITWKVVRIFDEEEDDMSAMDVLGYKNREMNGDKDFYQLVTDIHEQVTRTDTEGWGSPSGHDFFGRINSMQVDMAQMKEDIANLKAGGATVDVEKLAEAVAKKTADTIYARMKA